MKALLPHSLKDKVMLGYILGFLFMSGVVFINWQNFEGMKSLVLSAEKVSELIDTVFEVRRYEKNLFLYGERLGSPKSQETFFGNSEDYRELTLYLERLDTLLKENEKDIILFSNEKTISDLKRDLQQYKEYLSGYGKVNHLSSWEEKVRSKGREIVKIAEDISKMKTEKLTTFLLSLRNVLILSILFLASTGFIAGAILYRSFARPLILFEQHMKRISEGEYSFIPVLSQDREMLSLSKAFNRMLAELELRQAHLIRTEKLASLGTLLFGVAHELNNPLNNISTSCQILKEELEGPDMEFKKELLNQIEEEADRARDIVRSILDYSKAGNKELVNLRKVINDAVRFMKAEIPPKIELSMNLPEDLVVFADPQQLKQVFLNLLKNSVEAMDGEGRITISARLHDNHIEIRFSDTGKGMTQEVLSKIFDPFFTTKEGRRGYGLGLFVTHNIIREHEGTIDVQSTPGHGTTFLIRLPERGVQ